MLAASQLVALLHLTTQAPAGFSGFQQRGEAKSQIHRRSFCLMRWSIIS